MGLVVLLLRRLGRLALTVLLISTVVFLVLRIIPGDPARVIAGMDADPADIAAIRSRLGTDVPVVQQYVSWLLAVLRADFGVSYLSGQPVTALILQRFPLTLALAVMGMAIGLVVAVPLGVVSAVHRGGFLDIGGLVFTQIGMAIPSFWLGILLLLLFSVRLRWFPLFGSGSLRHLVLPAVSLGIARAAVLTRLARASMVEELGKEYVVTARAKGLRESRVRYIHALRNALLPIITIAGIQLGYMLGGAIIVEQVFSLPGLGRLLLTAIQQRDFPLVQGGVVCVAILFTLINFGVDMLYTAVNPRIRLGR
jgi:peptide/nickel transport system permease protein